jgi:YD repeat-containing protein
MTTTVTTVRRASSGKIAGTENDDGRVTEVVRDKQGRIEAIRGSRDPVLRQLHEAVTEANERTRSLQQALEDRQSLENSLEEHAASLERLAATTAANLERQMRAEKQKALHAEGWVEAEGFYFSQPNLAEASRRYGLRWPQTVRWHDRFDETVTSDTVLGWWSGYERGAGHILNIRRGLTKTLTREVLLHEMAHAVQYERAPQAFNQELTAGLRRALEDEAKLLVTRCDDLQVVRGHRPLSHHAPAAPPQLAASHSSQREPTSTQAGKRTHPRASKLYDQLHATFAISKSSPSQADKAIPQ